MKNCTRGGPPTDTVRFSGQFFYSTIPLLPPPTTKTYINHAFAIFANILKIFYRALENHFSSTIEGITYNAPIENLKKTENANFVNIHQIKNENMNTTRKMLLNVKNIVVLRCQQWGVRNFLSEIFMTDFLQPQLLISERINLLTSTNQEVKVTQTERTLIQFSYNFSRNDILREKTRAIKI